MTNSARGEHFRRIGRDSWLALGIIALAVVLFGALGAIRGIVVPLVVAFIIGTLLQPLVDSLEQRGVKRTLAAVIGLLITLAVGAGITAIVVWGFLQQVPQIYSELVSGWHQLLAWLQSLDLDPYTIERGWAQLQSTAIRLSYGVVGLASSALSGILSFAVGIFFAVFFLFFILRDGPKLSARIATASHWDPAVVEQVVNVSSQSLRGYFRGTALTAVITGPIFVIPLLLLKIPLIIPIIILYFFLSFIPFLGAWVTGFFAIMIAFGAAGPTAAAIVGVTLLISNGTIQSAVSSWALGSSLKIHPVTVLIATLVGGTIAGILGMVLGAPLVAAVSKSIVVIKSAQENKDEITSGDEDDLLPPFIQESTSSL